MTSGLWHSRGGKAPNEANTAGRADALYPDFTDELTEALAEFWRGALMPG